MHSWHKLLTSLQFGSLLPKKQTRRKEEEGRDEKGQGREELIAMTERDRGWRRKKQSIGREKHSIN